MKKILSGVLFALIGALAYPLFFPEFDLTYEVSNLLKVGPCTALTIAVRNGGRTAEQNIRLEISKAELIAKQLSSACYFISNKNGFVDEKDKYVYQIDRLVSGDQAIVSFILPNVAAFRLDNMMTSSIRVKSSNRVASEKVNSNKVLLFLGFSLCALWGVIVGIFLVTRKQKKYQKILEKELQSTLETIVRIDRKTERLDRLLNK